MKKIRCILSKACWIFVTFTKSFYKSMGEKTAQWSMTLKFVKLLFMEELNSLLDCLLLNW